MALGCTSFLPRLLLLDTSETDQNDKPISKHRLIVYRSNFLIFIFREDRRAYSHLKRGQLA